MPIKFTREIFKANAPFYPAFVAVSQQTWGGKIDSIIQPIARIFQQNAKDTQELQDKYLEQWGIIQENGSYGLDGTTKENAKEYHNCMKDALAVEIVLPIEEPIKLVMKKHHNVSGFQAAAVEDVFIIEWQKD